MFIASSKVIWFPSFAKLGIQHPSGLNGSLLHKWNKTEMAIGLDGAFCPLCIVRRCQRFFAWSLSFPLSSTARSRTFWPGWPVSPDCKLTVRRTQSCPRIAPDTRTVASRVGNVINRLFPNIGRRSIVADEEVLIIPSKSSILKLSPPASNVGRVLPNQLSVITNAFAALISGSAKDYEWTWLCKLWFHCNHLPKWFHALRIEE